MGDIKYDESPVVIQNEQHMVEHDQLRRMMGTVCMMSLLGQASWRLILRL